jgi:iron(III) transport system substrate-binding protein
MATRVSRRAFLIGGLAAPVIGGCRSKEGRAGRAVTLYVSLDEPYARPILEAFSRETGFQVRPVYDTEANKSRGLAQRILSEMGRPRADVFWSSEVLQMLSLREGAALEPYAPVTAAGIPARFRDPQAYWTGFAARFRVLAIHRGVAGPPRSLLELADPRWKGQVAMAQPLFGTTTTEVAALFQVLGAEKARAYYQARKANGTVIVDGNSVAAELAARGDVRVAQTDTDDAYSRVDAGRELQVLFPDQGGMGALLVPNTVGLVRGGPNPAGGKALVEYLLRPDTELALAALPSRQLPLHPGLEPQLPEKVRPLARVKPMAVDYNRLPEIRREVDAFLRETFGA